MKVILYMATTPNGMIAKEDGNSDWVSEEDVKSFTQTCQKAQVVIMGKNTYDVLYPDELPLKEGIHVVWTKDLTLTSDNPTVLFTNKTPEEILSIVEQKGYNEACLIGGSQTVSQFMESGLIDEIYLDIEPLLFGKGMLILKNVDLECQLQLIDMKKLNDKGTIQVHYKVMK